MPKTQSLQAAVLPSEVLRNDHYHSLNGLRGISIILVILTHSGWPFLSGFEILVNGPLGVNIFFAVNKKLAELIEQGSLEPAIYNDEAFWQLELNRNEQARELMRLAKERGAYDAYSDSVMKVVEKRLGKQN